MAITTGLLLSSIFNRSGSSPAPPLSLAGQDGILAGLFGPNVAATNDLDNQLANFIFVQPNGYFLWTNYLNFDIATPDSAADLRLRIISGKGMTFACSDNSSNFAPTHRAPRQRGGDPHSSRRRQSPIRQTPIRQSPTPLWYRRSMNRKREFLPSTLNSGPACITNVSPSSLSAKILP